jgi:hypothetical protein
MPEQWIDPLHLWDVWARNLGGGKGVQGRGLIHSATIRSVAWLPVSDGTVDGVLFIAQSMMCVVWIHAGADPGLARQLAQLATSVATYLVNAPLAGLLRRIFPE